MKAITKKQIEVLKCINDFINENGYSPTIRELCEIMDLSSPATMHTHLIELSDKGYITYVVGKSRTIRIIKNI